MNNNDSEINHFYLSSGEFSTSLVPYLVYNEENVI